MYALAALLPLLPAHSVAVVATSTIVIVVIVSVAVDIVVVIYVCCCYYCIVVYYCYDTVVDVAEMYCMYCSIHSFCWGFLNNNDTCTINYVWCDTVLIINIFYMIQCILLKPYEEGLILTSCI